MWIRINTTNNRGKRLGWPKKLTLLQVTVIQNFMCHRFSGFLIMFFKGYTVCRYRKDMDKKKNIFYIYFKIDDETVWKVSDPDPNWGKFEDPIQIECIWMPDTGSIYILNNVRYAACLVSTTPEPVNKKNGSAKLMCDCQHHLTCIKKNNCLCPFRKWNNTRRPVYSRTTVSLLQTESPKKSTVFYGYVYFKGISFSMWTVICDNFFAKFVCGTPRQRDYDLRSFWHFCCFNRTHLGQKQSTYFRFWRKSLKIRIQKSDSPGEILDSQCHGPRRLITKTPWNQIYFCIL